jgi:hypothetical protein
MRVVAQRPQVVIAVPAGPAPYEGRDDDPVTNGVLRRLGADLDDLAHVLVADDVALAHRRDVAVDEMQVRAAGSSSA